MSNLKDQLIKLGDTNPGLRKNIRPVLASLGSGGLHKRAQSLRDVQEILIEGISVMVHEDSYREARAKVGLYRSMTSCETRFA